jgi:O-methyltransferase
MNQASLRNFLHKPPADQARAIKATVSSVAFSSIKNLASRFGYELRRHYVPPHGIADSKLYTPRFSPWLGEEFSRYFAIAAPQSLVTADRCYVLYTLLTQSLSVAGDVVECGVYRGGTAAMMARIILDNGKPKKLYLFDTFDGMPLTDPTRDLHQKGDFSDTSLEKVRSFVAATSITEFRKGLIPDTFSGLEKLTISLAHIDVDIYRSILDSIEFIWPRLTPGGFLVFDDYGFASCPGARQAVDEFFASTSVRPLCLSTGQAIVFKGCS